MNERYDVLDGNGGVLHSTNLWWEACQVLRSCRELWAIGLLPMKV